MWHSFAGCCKECNKNCCPWITSPRFEEWNSELWKVSSFLLIYLACLRNVSAISIFLIPFLTYFCTLAIVFPRLKAHFESNPRDLGKIINYVLALDSFYARRREILRGWTVFVQICWSMTKFWARMPHRTYGMFPTTS